MITGYNTDVRHGEVVLHVQTEDKGMTNPCVESLVYVGGQVLARKRAGYRALLEDGGGKEAIVELMESQHRSMIDEIRRGRLDEQLIAMGKLRALQRPGQHPGGEAGAAPAVEESAASRPAPYAPLGEASEQEQSLDQVILDYLNAEAQQEYLDLVAQPVEPLRLGQPAVLRVFAMARPADVPVAGAAVRVRLISTTEGPVELGEGETDENGRLELPVSIPELPSGTAALIIEATSEIGEAEVKQLI